MDAPLKWGPFLLTIVLLVAGQVYTTGVRDTKQAQTEAIVTEMRSEVVAFQKDAAEQKQLAAVHYTESQDFQATTIQSLKEIFERVVVIERSRH